MPVLQDEFRVTPVQGSMTVSIVIMEIVLSNLFFGFLEDRGDKAVLFPFK